MRKKVYGAILLVIIGVAAFFYYSNSAPEVETTTVVRGDIQHSVVDTGYVQSAQKLDVYATQGGRITSIPVQIGQEVEKGQVIMTLQNRDLTMASDQLKIQLSQASIAVGTAEAAIEQESLNLADAQSKFVRAQDLYSAGAISQVEYEETCSLLEKSQSSLASQEQSLQLAREQVSNYETLLASSRHKENELQVRSPINGTLMLLPVQQEQAAVYGTLLAQVALANDLQIKVDLLSDDLGEIQIGQKVQITAPVLGDTILTGEVLQIYPRAEEKQSALGVIQRRVPAIISLEDADILKPGYETKVSIITAARENILVVPREAVRTNANGDNQVMVIDNDRIVIRIVTTGLNDSKKIEIIDGLQQGEQIIKDASADLQPNTKVRSKTEL